MEIVYDAFRAIHVRQPRSAPARDKEQTPFFEESQAKTSPSVHSRLEEHTFVARTPHVKHFLCARDACSRLSLLLFLYLLSVTRVRCRM
jgi:hypothetical protein